MNDKYDTITLSISNYDAIKEIERLKEANDIIVKCTRAIIKSYQSKEVKEESNGIFSTIKRKINEKKGDQNK